MNILQINTSAKRNASESTRLATRITESLVARHADAKVTLRDLAVNPLPAIDETILGALFTPADARSPAQNDIVAASDALVAELQAADVLVLGVPMYNLGVPAQAKHWIDAIARAGVTFRYTANGPEGMVKGKTVYLALTRGGIYRDTPMDTLLPYLRTVLGFLGMNDVRPVFAEGLAMGADVAAKAFAEAEREIEALV